MRRQLWFVAISAAAAIGLMTAAMLSPALAEWYAVTAFPALMHWGTKLAAQLPMPAAELMWMTGGLWLGIQLLVVPIKALFSHSPAALARLGLRLLCAVSALTFGYVGLWAPLYSRTPPIYATAETDEYALSELCDLLIQEANELRSQLPEDGRGLAKLARSEAALLDSARNLVSEVTGFSLSTPKALRYPELFDALGISGMYFPWTFESLVNLNDLDSALPFTATHEAAHQAGYAKEDEASYIGWLACMNGDVAFQYSGTVSVLLYAMDQLRALDPQIWHMAVLSMSDGLERDFRASNGYASASEGAISRAQTGVADVFLRLNGQRDGILSYGGVVMLVRARLIQDGVL